MKSTLQALQEIEDAIRQIIKATEADEDDIFLPLSGEEAQRINIIAEDILGNLKYV